MTVAIATPLCGAKKKGGGACGREAGWGTAHAGIGACKLHGGSTPNHNTAAAPALAQTMGGPLDLSPHDALIWCVRTAAGELAYCNAMVSLLGAEDVVGNPLATLERPLKEEKGAEDPEHRVTEERRGTPELNIWVRARHDAMDRLAKFSKMALDAGVAERQVQLAERYGETIAASYEVLIDGLELTAAQRKKLRVLIPNALAVLEGTATLVA
jgi:hypothetical protein